MKDIAYYKKLNYPLTIQREEDGSYFAEYTDLKGCMPSAESIDQLYEMAIDTKEA